MVGSTASTANPNANINSIDYGLSDDEFEDWIRMELCQKDPLLSNTTQYSHLFTVLAPRAIRQWRQRYRGNPVLWRRVFKKERVIKEFVEAVPIMDAVLQYVHNTNQHNITIIDLASGKGFLSMFLSEMLANDTHKVDRLVLMDKAWPMQNQIPQDHHMNWDHIYGTIPSNNNNNSQHATIYQQTWPIPLVTSKQDLKQSCNHRTLKQRFFSKAQGPIVVLAVHLCGTLSLKAIDLFHDNPDTIQFLALKPCCLPPMIHAQREEVFVLGKHRFEAAQVCASGKWSGKQWYGPPRWHLEHRFQTWAEQLFLGVGNGTESQGGDDNIRLLQKTRVQVKVQSDGGYQNAFIFAQRPHIIDSVWERLQHNQVASFYSDTGSIRADSE